MTFTVLPALVAFAFASSITPGPNNLMLMASGANFGLRRSLPHMLGVSLGHMFMVICMGIGLVQVFEAVPATYTVLKVVSVGYLLFLAWKIANSAPRAPDAPETGGKPFTFLQAAAFQWVNPKAWFMAITAITAYVVDHTFLGVLLVAGVFACTNLPSITVWTALGQQMRRFLTNPARLRAFNVTMALLLMATIWPIIMSH